MGFDIIWIYYSILFWYLCEFVCFICFVLNSVSTPAANITASINSIPMLNGTNFKALQESVMITFEVMDLDLALRVPKPANLTDKSTSDEKREMEKWEKSNHISLMVIKRAIP